MSSQEREVVIKVDAVGVFFVALGVAALAAALLPRLLGRAPVSMPMVFLGAGIAVFAAVPSLPAPDPMVHPDSRRT